MPEGKYHSLYVPLSVVQRDLSVTGGPAAGASLLGIRTFGRSDLATWSAVIDSGAILATGLKDNVTFWQISTLPLPTWNSEFGMQVPVDPVFTGFPTTPKRIAAITKVSRQLLIQSPDLEEMLRADFARQLGSLVDQVCLLGQGSSANQPTGVAATAGVHSLATNTYADFVHAERLIGDANISLDSYAVITSPAGKEILQTKQVVTGYPVFVWQLLRNPKSSAQVSDNKAYCGAWAMLTIAIWGALEIHIDPFTYADTNNLWVDVAVRLPAAFAVTAGPVS